jgi:hypothetical protein
MPLHLQRALEFRQSRRFRLVEHRLPLGLDIELARLDSTRYDNELEKQLDSARLVTRSDSINS